MSEPRIGLALGGGAARGLAHIPLLEVFDELGVKPALIAGTSIGALVGSAYASGVPGRDIAQHARQVLGKRAETLKYIMSRSRGSVFSLLDLKGFGSVQIDGRTLTELVLPDGVAGRIEETEIPLKVIATDFYGQCQVTISSGALIDAIAASIAIPGIISAPEFDGRLLVDGGMTNPVPFDCVREGCDAVIAIDVTGRPVPRRDYPTNRDLVVGAFLTMFAQIARLRRQNNPPEVYLQPPVEKFQAHEFFRVEEIIAAGASLKDELKRSVENLISVRVN